MSLHSKVDVLADAIKKIVEYNTLFSTKLEAKTKLDSTVFDKLEEFLGCRKESLSKLDLTQQSTFSLVLGPLLKLVNMIPTDAPPIKQVVQGGDKGVGS